MENLTKIHCLDFNNFIQFKNSIYDKFKKTEEYNKLFSDWKVLEFSDMEIEDLIFSSFMKYTKETE